MDEQSIIPKAAEPETTKPEKEESLFLLSEVHKTPHLTQRELSSRLNISVGKTNYLIQQLMRKGLIKVKNFSHSPGKLKKVKYILTKKGVEEKINLTYHFLKRKEAEYNHIRGEWEKLNNLTKATTNKETNEGEQRDEEER